MRGGRVAIILVLLVSLVFSGITRDLARSRRGKTSNDPSTGTTANLSSMNSFALALLLGGLRGPLVMMLWSSSEGQKVDKNLEDFDTKVEWIRLLQPEFDTVHIFQIWNKAYNVSVMMASLANKYITILDALDYAHRVNAQRPHNINIIYAIGQTLFDKLGNSQEKVYYRNRVREESKPHLPRQKLARDDPGWRPLDFDPVVDEKGYILPKYLVPSGPLIADANNPAERYDGSELQFLKQYEPFPFGVTPFGLAFNYQKRAQVLGSVGNRRHAQLSPVVIDSRPPLALKFWADEELERGRRMEMEAFGKTAPPERWDMELTTASIAPDAAPVDASKIPETLYSYERAARLNRDAYAEFARHIKSPTFGLSINTYDSHMRSVEGLAELSQADYLYLKSASAPPAEQAQLRAAAADHYRKSAVIHRYIALKYFTDHPFNTQALPPGVSVDQLKPEQYPEVLARVQQLVKTLKVPDVQAEDRHEYECYIERAEQRLKRL